MKAMRNHALDLYIDWVVKNGRRPQYKDFGREATQLNVKQAKLYGTGSYRAGKGQAGLAIFRSEKDAEEAVQARAKERSITIPDS